MSTAFKDFYECEAMAYGIGHWLAAMARRAGPRRPIGYDQDCSICLAASQSETPGSGTAVPEHSSKQAE